MGTLKIAILEKDGEELELPEEMDLLSALQFVNFIPGSKSVGLHTSSFTVSGSEDILLSSGSNAITATLPDAVGYNKILVFKHVGTSDLTIQGASGQTIDEKVNIKLRASSKQSVSLFSDGSNWWVI